MELNPTVLLGVVIFWENIWFTLGMGENSCPQMDGFVLCFILELAKARGTWAGASSIADARGYRQGLDSVYYSGGFPQSWGDRIETVIQCVD